MKTKDEISGAFAVTASFLISGGSVCYFIENIAGQTRPNASSWCVFAFISILNALSYRKMADGDEVKGLFPIVNSCSCVAIAVLVISKGYFKDLSAGEWWCLGLGASAGLLWWRFKKRKFAASLVQIIVEIAAIFGFLPTIAAVIRNPDIESSAAWFVWSVSFVLQFLVAWLRRKGNYVELLFPVNRFILNFGVGLLALR